MDVVTLGFALFEVQPDWLTGADPGLPSFRGVTVMADGSLLTAHAQDGHSLFRWASSGTFLGPFSTEIAVRDPHAVRCAPDGSVWIVDRAAHVVRRFTNEGALLRTIGDEDRPQYGAPLNHPAGVAADPDGTTIIGDGYGNSLLHVFDAEGEVLRSFGDVPGGMPVDQPHDVAFLPDQTVVVADKTRNRLVRFGIDGGLLAVVDGAYRPTSIDVLGDHILVLDETPRLSAYRLDLSVAGRCQPVAQKGHGVCADADGNIYITEPAGPSRLTRLRRI